MDSASSETGEEEAPPFLSSTADSNIEWPKLVNASVREGKRLVSKSLLRYVRHDWLHSYSLEFWASQAVCFDGTQG